MHDIALLKRLPKTQLELVIRLDPLTRGSSLWGKQMLFELTQFIGNPDLVNALLLSWAKQLEKNGMDGIASDYYRVYDERTGLSEKRAHAIRIGSFDFLMECENAEWFHVAQTGHRALQLQKAKEAFGCFEFLLDRATEIFPVIENTELLVEKITEAKTKAKRMMSCAQKGFKKILPYVLCDASTELVEKCLHALDRGLTQPETRDLRYCLVTLFAEDKLDATDTEFMIEFLMKHGSDSEKRACLNRVASRGETRALEEFSVKWNIPLTERRWRLALGKHWYSQKNGGNATERVYIATKLIAFSPRYEPMLLRARISAREEAIGFGDIVLANEIGDLIGEALTLDELTGFIRMYGKDKRYQMTQVPFAMKKISELVFTQAPSEKTTGE